MCKISQNNGTDREISLCQLASYFTILSHMMDVAAVKGPSVLKHCFFPGWDPQNMIVWWFMGLCGGTAQNHLKKNMSVFCLTFLHLNTAHCRRSTEEFKTSDGVQLRNWREDLRVRMESTEVRVCRGTKTPIRETMKTVCVCVCVPTYSIHVLWGHVFWTIVNMKLCMHISICRSVRTLCVWPACFLWNQSPK